MNCADWLPKLVLFEDYNGDWDDYLEAIYEIFKRDFVDSKPTFLGRRMGMRRYPITFGKEAAFWHFVSDGPVEVDRLPDLRRCERMKWPKPIIESANDASRVKWWETKRQIDKRILIALNDFSYIVVLLDKGKYLLPLTAYQVERQHRQEKLRKEYQEFVKNLKKG